MKLPLIEKYKNWVGLRINSPLRKAPKRDFVFIHINKTAGTSIISHTGKPFRKHLTAREVIDVIGQARWDAAYKFSVVRNPWDKMVSHYKHNIKTKPDSMAVRGGSEPIPFHDWLRLTLGPEKDRKYYNRPQHFLPQVDWLKDYQGRITMDSIIRFEALADGYRWVAEDLGLPKQIPHLNATSGTRYRDYYDDTSKALVADWFWEDLGAFDYTF